MILTICPSVCIILTCVFGLAYVYSKKRPAGMLIAASVTASAGLIMTLIQLWVSS